ncbi:hypothetical protein KI387_006384, partial [Taxus chinensis]
RRLWFFKHKRLHGQSGGVVGLGGHDPLDYALVSATNGDIALTGRHFFPVSYDLDVNGDDVVDGKRTDDLVCDHVGRLGFSPDLFGSQHAALASAPTTSGYHTSAGNDVGKGVCHGSSRDCLCSGMIDTASNGGCGHPELPKAVSPATTLLA